MLGKIMLGNHPDLALYYAPFRKPLLSLPPMKTDGLRGYFPPPSLD
jgi:hypothetical protein